MIMITIHAYPYFLLFVAVATSSRPCDDNDDHLVAHTGLSSPSPGKGACRSTNISSIIVCAISPMHVLIFKVIQW